ncbi:hypothetical protein OG809_35240 [Kribbella soli]|jgi:hypothetical protein
MSSTPQHRAELFVMMQLRRLSFGHNLLRRRVDRIEAAFLLVAIAVALLVIPAAAALGTTLHDRAEQSATEERASVHQVRDLRRLPPRPPPPRPPPRRRMGPRMAQNIAPLDRPPILTSAE